MPFTEAEQHKLDVITASIEKRITNRQAALELKLTVRQLQRLKAAVKAAGTAAVVHKLKGKSSNHRIDQNLKEELLGEIKVNYHDFKPGFATEKLQEKYSTTPTSQTIRIWMAEIGLWRVRKQKASVYRSWRSRREYFGELIQFDGSYHHWFENRLIDKDGNPVEVCLLAAIDDATGKITKASFGANEGVVAIFLFWLDYVRNIGKPIAIYLDRYSTYKINHKAAVDNFELVTQFGRAMQSLSIEVIFANSPQAKGRVERLFKTLQDRLVKEMRLKGIKTQKEGTRFFREVYIPMHNAKFAVAPREKADLHRPVLKSDNLQRILTIQSKRLVSKDLIAHYKNTRYQLLPKEGYRYTLKKATVVVEEKQDGKIVFRYKDQVIPSSVAVQKVRRQKAPQVVSSKDFKEDRIRTPAFDHPWRQIGRLAITLAKQRHEAENGVTVLTGNGIQKDNPVISPV